MDSQSRGRRFPGDAAFIAIATILCFSRFRLGPASLQTYDDDFFYYLRTAINFAQTGRSTFDGVHLTNGYHPLWFLVIAAIYKLAPSGFFLAFQCVEFILSCTTYFLLKHLFLRLTQRHALACGSSLLAATLAASLARSGMEIGLLFPCVVAALAYRLRPAFAWTNRQATIYGLLLSLVVLARLDAVFLVLLMLTAEVDGSISRFFRRPAILACLCFGSSLVPVYLFMNHHFFHLWLPVSGEAKQLRLHFGPSLKPFLGIVQSPSPLLQALTWGALGLIVLSLFTLRRSHLPHTWRRMALGMLIFPVVHFSVLSLRSDWTIWPWYLYPFVLVYAASAIVLLPQASIRQEALFSRAGRIFCSALLVYALLVTRVSPAAQTTYAENLELAAWMHQHPGVYAMGDVSGMLSYMTDQRMVQVEGLMEDRDYLLAIRRQQPLVEVLRQYGADFYIAGREPARNHCVIAAEPAQAGPQSPHMYAQVCTVDALLQPDGVRHHQIYPIDRVRPVAAPPSQP